jgi:predicted RNA-binding Zn ribbon-like protein
LAAAELAYAIGTREVLAEILLDAIHERRATRARAGRFSSICEEARSAQFLLPHDRDWRWSWRTPAAPRQAAWVAALDAADLLTSGDLARVRQCGDAECGWLFFDTSRNGSRRWCSMDACGNRNKARRFYARSSGRRERPPRS